jgi:hypothetical protein
MNYTVIPVEMSTKEFELCGHSSGTSTVVKSITLKQQKANQLKNDQAKKNQRNVNIE